MTVTAGLIGLTDLRARAAAALAPTLDGDPAVLEAPVDAVDPPALIVAWEDPWVEFQTPCFWYANLVVLCVASRVEPAAGVETLEGLMAYVISRLRDDPNSWPMASTTAPRLFEINNIPLLGARLVYRAPVTF